MLHPAHPTLAQMSPISDPPPKWRTDLNEKDRESEWAKAAGTGKSPAQHRNARKRFIIKANEDAAEEKNGVGLTTEDNEVLKKKHNRSSKSAARCRTRFE